MTTRLYLDEYYTGIKKNTERLEIQKSICGFLNQNFPYAWYFGSTTISDGIFRCVYFNRDEDATLFLLKTSIPCRTINER